MEGSNYCIVEDDDNVIPVDQIDLTGPENDQQEVYTVQDSEDEPPEMLQFDQIYTYHEAIDADRYDNNSISQSKLLDRLFISRGPLVSVFKADDSLKVLFVLFIVLID